MSVAAAGLADVVQLLVKRWHSRCGNLDSYLRSIFHTSAPHSLPHRLHLSQMADGTINPEDIGHEFAAVWIVEGDQIREVPLNFEWQTRWDTDISDTYYLMHSYSFVLDGEKILLSERYGPNMRHRLRARLFPGPPLSAEWKTCWHSGPNPESVEPSAPSNS